MLQFLGWVDKGAGASSDLFLLRRSSFLRELEVEFRQEVLPACLTWVKQALVMHLTKHDIAMSLHLDSEENFAFNLN